MSSKHDDENLAICAGLDVVAEYQAMGLQIAGTPRETGYAACYAIGRQDRTPSASINIRTGRYKDSSTGELLSMWDFAVRHGHHADWKAARDHFALKARVTIASTKSTRADDKLDWLPWNDLLVGLWAQSKQGVTTEAIKLSGARLARYPYNRKKNTCGEYVVLAFPVYGPRLTDADPIAYVLVSTTGGKLPVWTKDGQVDQMVDKKTIGQVKGGWMNAHALELFPTPDPDRIVWKVEGLTDMLALQAAIPESHRNQHLVICNAGGSTEQPNKELVAKLSGITVAVVHDADTAGETGAAKWMFAMAGFNPAPRQVRLPYPIADKKGDDLRKWFSEGNGYHELIELAKQQAPAPPPAIDPDTNNSSMEETICQDLGLDVLGLRDGGAVEIWSKTHRRRFRINNVSRMSFEELLAYGGRAVKEKVLRTRNGADGWHGMDDVREAILYLAGYRLPLTESHAGIGCWEGISDDGNPNENIVIVGRGEAAELNGTGSLRKIDVPRVGGRTIDLNDDRDWYEFDTLQGHLALADPKWCASAILEATQVFGMLRWRTPDSDILVTGLVLATFVQTLWNWRPLVAIEGQSNSGKSMLFEHIMEPIFGKLAMRVDKPSEAGLRQGLKHHALAVMIDEFEKGAERQKILELLRTSSRGGKIFKGTVDQRGTSFGMRHIAWIAAVEVGLSRTPDLNRFICLEINSKLKSRQPFALPSRQYLADLGRRLLAVAIKSVAAARRVAAAMSMTPVPGVDPRVAENYIVPIAMIAAANGMDIKDARDWLIDYLKKIDLTDQSSSDEIDLLSAILHSQIFVPGGKKSVAQFLEEGSLAEEKVLAGCGIAKCGCGPEGEIGNYLFIAPNVVSRFLLQDTDWKGQNIKTILRRIEGAKEGRHRMGGTYPRGIWIPAGEVISQQKSF